MLARNSSSVTLAPCANSAVASRYGGRKTNVAISHAIANSAFSTDPSVSAATTGTICDAAASARLSAWLRRARPRKPRMSASSGGLVAVGPRQPEPPQRERDRGEQGQHPADLEHVRVGEAEEEQGCGDGEPEAGGHQVAPDLQPRALDAEAGVVDHQRPGEAGRAQHERRRADRVAERLLQVARTAAASSATTTPAPTADDTNTTSSERSSIVRCRAGSALGSSETSIVLQPRTVTMPSRVCALIAAAATPTSWASTSRATITQKTSPRAADSTCAVSRDRNGDQMPVATAWAVTTGVAVGSAITLRRRPRAAAAPSGRAARARPPRPPAPMVAAATSTIGTPQAQLLARPQPIGSGRELSWIST